MLQQIVGHQNQIAQLCKAVEENRLPHAYIFSGIQGIGKKRVAIGFAQFLICSSKNNHQACEKCEPCLKISKEMHSDLLTIAPNGKTIKVDVLRELKQKIHLHPLEAEMRIIVIDEAEKMTEAGANALLKILEEPPAENVFILVTDRPNQILPTILSRCHLLAFAPLSNPQIETILTSEGISSQEAKERSLLAQGSLKNAREISPQLYDEARTLLKKVEGEKSPALLLELSEQLQQHEQLIPILKLWQMVYHTLATQAPEEQIGRKLAGWDEVQSTLKGLEGYTNKQLLVENLLFKLAAAS